MFLAKTPICGDGDTFQKQEPDKSKSIKIVMFRAIQRFGANPTRMEFEIVADLEIILGHRCPESASGKLAGIVTTIPLIESAPQCFWREMEKTRLNVYQDLHDGGSKKPPHYAARAGNPLAGVQPPMVKSLGSPSDQVQ